MEKPKPDIIEETLKFWQPRSPEPLTREDAREMVENISGFFTILAGWAAQENSQNPNQDTGGENLDGPLL